MAKPGSDEAARIAGLASQAVDLRRLPDKILDRVRVEAEVRLGARCGGCERRIEGVGFRFHQVNVVVGKRGNPEVEVGMETACSHEECDHADQCRAVAAYVELFEIVWLDRQGDAGDDDEPAGAADVAEDGASDDAPAVSG